MKNSMRLPLSLQHAKIIQEILSSYPYSFFAFGSRIKQSHKEYSDLDLCYQTDIPDSTIAEILEKFEQSDLPFKVDFLAWKRCTPEFRALISNDLVPLELLFKRIKSGSP